MAKTLDVAMVDARLVASPFCVHVAAHKALTAATKGKAVAASLHAELVHCLHAGRNVGEALRVLGPKVGGAADAAAVGADVGAARGAGGATTDLLVCVFDAHRGITGVFDPASAALAGDAAAAEAEALAALAGLVAGEPASLAAYYGVFLAGRPGGSAVVEPAPLGAAPGPRVDVDAIVLAYRLAPAELVLAAGSAGAADSAGTELAALEAAVVQRIACQDIGA